MYLFVTYVRMYTQHVNLYTLTHIPTHTHTHAHTHTQAHTHAHTHLHAYTNTNTHTHTHTQTHSHTHPLSLTHTHTHVCVCMCVCVCVRVCVVCVCCVCVCVYRCTHIYARTTKHTHTFIITCESWASEVRRLVIVWVIASLLSSICCCSTCRVWKLCAEYLCTCAGRLCTDGCARGVPTRFYSPQMWMCEWDRRPHAPVNRRGHPLRRKQQSHWRLCPPAHQTSTHRMGHLWLCTPA